MAGKRKTTFVEDLSGRTIGRLTILDFFELRLIEYKSKPRIKEIWNCICQCGEKTTITRNAFISKQKLSCGCLLREKRGSNPSTLPKGVAAFNAYIASYKERSEKKNIDFNLSVEEFKNFIYDDCYFCGQKPIRPQPKNKKTYGKIYVNGIDRLNSNIGYTQENCVSCCEICNKAKRDLSIEEFSKWIYRIKKFDFPIPEKN